MRANVSSIRVRRAFTRRLLALFPLTVTYVLLALSAV